MKPTHTKKTATLFWIFAMSLSSTHFAYSEGNEKEHHEEESHEEEEVSPSVGAGKAVTEANKKEGLKLSEKAIASLGITYLPASSSETQQLPLSCVVFFQDEAGVYRVRNGWIKLIEIEITARKNAEITFKTREIAAGDQIVKGGVPLLRAAELEALSGSGEGHGH